MFDGDAGCEVRAGGLAFGVVSISGEAEADGAGVALLCRGEILGEPREFAEQERQDPGGHGVESAKMSDGFLAGDSAQAIDDVVAGHAGGFVDYEQSVQGEAVSFMTVEQLGGEG